MSFKRHEACSPIPRHDLAETDRGDRVVAGLWSSVRESAAFISEETGNHGWGGGGSQTCSGHWGPHQARGGPGWRR